MATIHAFNHNPTMASAAAACGAPSAPRGPRAIVNCLACVEILDESRWMNGAIVDMHAEALAENERREPAAVDGTFRSPEVSGRWAGATDAERVELINEAHGEALAADGEHVPCAGSGDCYCADREPAAGTVYGRPTPMPAPAAEPVDGREPDAYGVAVGDLIAGTDVTIQCSAVGIVLAIVPYVPYAGMDGNRYRVRCGDLYATGEVVERILHDHPSVIVPAGEPVVCATCGGRHESAERFVACLVAHVRAEREAAAVSA